MPYKKPNKKNKQSRNNTTDVEVSEGETDGRGEPRQGRRETVIPASSQSRLTTKDIVHSRYIYVPPPFEKFFGQNNIDWASWIRKFERYRVTSLLNYEPQATQVSSLLLAMGDDAEYIYDSFGLENVTYEELVNRFGDYFERSINIIYERARFNKRNQLEGESFENYLTSLHKLVKSCNFGALKDEMLRDRIVVGVKDDKLSESLQMDRNLSLNKAIDKVKLWESVKTQQETVRGVSKGLEALSVTRKVQFKSNKNYFNSSKSFKCYRCGDTNFHEKEACPGYKIRCRYCNIIGHFERCCSKKKKEVKELSASEPPASESAGNNYTGPAALGTVELSVQSLCITPPYEVRLEMENVPIVFKIDTGADVSCIPETLWKHSFSKLKLDPFNGCITSAGQNSLNCLGRFSSILNLRGKECRETLFVIRNLKQPLLGRPAISALSLIKYTELQNDSESFKVSSVDFPELFSPYPGILKGDPYVIKMKNDTQPYAVVTPRRIPLPLVDKVKTELGSMEKLGIIEKVTEGTEWCSPIVVVPKKDGTVRICVDFTKLNVHVVRERLILPSTDECLAKINKGAVFSKLDARMGFWQIPLATESRNLTTFLTPFGRYRFTRLPFGICSAPEHFQRRLYEILNGLEGCVNLMDDILVFGQSIQEHNIRLNKVLRRLSENNITLNKEKCEFGKSSVVFLGHEISAEGIKPDINKIKAVLDMPPPKNIHELRRFFGMYNYLTKFVNNVSQKSQSLRELLRDDVDFHWGVEQQKSFDIMKNVLVSAPVLSMYDPNAETRVLADSSSFALGACLEQKHGDTFHPVMYISRALTPAEQAYAQIEKEALAVTWACERLSLYITGKRFTILTDHKPLVSLLGSKLLETLSPRILRFRLRLLAFDFTLIHVSGKKFFVPDTLSRIEGLKVSVVDTMLCEVLENEILCIKENSPVKDVLHQQIENASKTDLVINMVKQAITNGWVSDGKMNPKLSPYYKYRDSLSWNNGLLMMANRIVIPQCLKTMILDKLHSGHTGITKCRRLAQDTVWWPGISNDISQKVTNCYTCMVNENQKREPLISTPFPNLPWSVVGCDFCKVKNQMYLVVQDYYSRYLDVIPVNSTAAHTSIQIMKRLFSQFGVPHTLRCDNGPPFDSEEFKNFAKDWGFTIKTSSPNFPQSNGLAESAVATAKKIILKCSDMYEGLLVYRSTPLENGYSPSELLMSRKLRGTVPIAPINLIPKTPDYEELCTKEEKIRERRKEQYDKRHNTKEKEELVKGQLVYVRDKGVSGRIIQKHDSPRSYVIETDEGGRLRRNRIHLSGFKKEETEAKGKPTSPVTFGDHFRPQRVVKPPHRLNL